MLAFSVEFCADDLYLVDCFRRVAEFAWWAETVRVGGSSEPELVDARIRQVEFDLILGTVFAQIERQMDHPSECSCFSH